MSSASSPASLISQPSSILESDNTSTDENLLSSGFIKSSQKESSGLDSILRELFEQNVVAKLWRTASTSQASGRPWPTEFPEFVPQDGPDAGRYVLRDAEFWTCGFFPGSLYELLVRSIRHPQSILPKLPIVGEIFQKKLHQLCQIWSEPLHDMAARTDTHDIGFIIMPALRLEWETTGDQRSLNSIIRAAHSLATRYVPSAGVIRSWDLVIKKDIVVTDMETNIIVIIDSLCNLDLLFYASAHSGDSRLAIIAETHAKSLIRTHLRPESVVSMTVGGYQGQLFSTCHVANVDPMSGDVKQRFTAQGYDHSSTWARGQSWAILGYAQTYMWTKNRLFLDVACGVAEYFLFRMDTLQLRDARTKSTQRYSTPPWDFDAPEDLTLGSVVRDSSSAFIAANGLLILSQALNADQQYRLSSHFLSSAMNLVKGTLEYSLAQEKAEFKTGATIDVKNVEDDTRFDSILKHGTANNNENARRQYRNHGLVYGDYYLVQFGNRLLQMGLV